MTGPVPGPVLGTCIWCGHSLACNNPGTPPGDCITDGPGFYAPGNIWRDFTLVDIPYAYGTWCPLAPPHPLGMLSAHQLVYNAQQP